MRRALGVPCCLILLACLIDRGDGQWKRLKLNELKHDVYLLEKLAENLEHEIEDFYDETHTAGHQVPSHDRHHHHSKRKHKSRTKKPRIHSTPSTPNVTIDFNKRNTELAYAKPTRSFPKEPSIDLSKKVNSSEYHWPKFEEILSMNRRKYDWKNDRWIKLNKISPKVDVKKIETIHKSKHRFNYRRVRLENGKAKGNVVIAVSAVR